MLCVSSYAPCLVFVLRQGGSYPKRYNKRNCAASGTRTRTAITGQGILSPSCLPFHHHGKPLAKLATIIESRKRFPLFFASSHLHTLPVCPCSGQEHTLPKTCIILYSHTPRALLPCQTIPFAASNLWFRRPKGMVLKRKITRAITHYQSND